MERFYYQLPRDSIWGIPELAEMLYLSAEYAPCAGIFWLQEEIKKGEHERGKLHFNMRPFLLSSVLSSITSPNDIWEKYNGENLRQSIPLEVLVSVFFIMCNLLKAVQETSLENADKLLSYFTIQRQKCAFINFFVAFEQAEIRQHYGTTVFYHFGGLENSSDAFPNFDVDQLCLVEIKIRSQQAGIRWRESSSSMAQHPFLSWGGRGSPQPFPWYLWGKHLKPPKYRHHVPFMKLLEKEMVSL